ncbi:MAG: hypothetical protein ACXWBP_07380 [Limisphaerales bacterium]
MLKRSLIIALAVLVVYNVCLLSPRFRNFYSIQSQWQNNLITAQKYALANPAPDVVLVGSSLAAQMPKKSLEPGVYNLSFAGGSMFTGLELIESAKVKPKLVAIEINVISKKSDQQVIENVSRPVFAWLRGFAPAFQEQFQPANLVAGRLTRAPIEKISEIKSRFSHKETKQESDIFKRMLNIALENNSTPVEPALMSEQLAALHQHVKRLQKQGVRCAFVEMPVDSKLAKATRCTEIRTKLLEDFPPTQYQWIIPEQNHNYATTDGQHLQPKDAEAVAVRIRTAFEQTNGWPVMRSASASP